MLSPSRPTGGTIWCQFRQIWFSSFCEEQANVFEIFDQFLNLHKKGGKSKKNWRQYDVLLLILILS